MTGWRVGYLVANRQIADLARNLQEPQVSCPSTISQKAAEAHAKPTTRRPQPAFELTAVYQESKVQGLSCNPGNEFADVEQR
jgi:aspartate/methionine/tyrosine aminotransferase